MLLQPLTVRLTLTIVKRAQHIHYMLKPEKSTLVPEAFRRRRAALRSSRSLEKKKEKPLGPGKKEPYSCTFSFLSQLLIRQSAYIHVKPGIKGVSYPKDKARQVSAEL